MAIRSQACRKGMQWGRKQRAAVGGMQRGGEVKGEASGVGGGAQP